MDNPGWKCTNEYVDHAMISSLNINVKIPWFAPLIYNLKNLTAGVVTKHSVLIKWTEMELRTEAIKTINCKLKYACTL